MDISNDLIKLTKSANPEIIKAMEEVEDWVVSDKNFEKKMDKFLSNFSKINSKKEIKKEILLELLAFLHTGNNIDVINVISKFDIGFTEDLVSVVNDLNKNDNNKYSKIFSERLLVIYRLTALTRIFSTKRLKALANTISEL